MTKKAKKQPATVNVNDLPAPPPTLTKMSRSEHDEFVEGGCDPHCHACGKKISIGDWWGFKRFVPAGEIQSPKGLSVGNIDGTCCEQCVKEDRGLSDEERARMNERLRVALDAPVKPKAPPKETASTRHGSFRLPDGTRF